MEGEAQWQAAVVLIAVFVVACLAGLLIRFTSRQDAANAAQAEREGKAGVRRAAETRECGSYCKHGMLRIEWHRDGALRACECAYPAE
jgi:hypothetical protein